MKISIFGMGYVGVVTGACFAREGHRVVGVDVVPHKVKMLKAGKSPVLERGLAELIAAVVRDERLRATEDYREAVLDSEVSLVSVGTPALPSGGVDMRAILAVIDQIGSVLAGKKGFHTVVIRSTLLPGTTRKTIIPRLESVSSRRCGEDFQVCYNPEFLREGRSISDFFEAPYTLIGEGTEGAGDRVVELYSGLKAPIHRSTLEVAESIKYASNAFHAVKVAFANELAVILKGFDVDTRAVMDLFCRDTKLNISSAYLHPGYGFGGSCLPKDLRALVHAARRSDIEAPLLGGTLESNSRHIERAVRMVLDAGERDVALLGLSFKDGTDDLRESPLVLLAERLIGKGYRLRIYDPIVTLAKLTGANLHYIEKEIPQIGDLLTDDLDRALRGVRVAVVGNSRPCDPERLALWAREGTLIDLHGVPSEVARVAFRYQGIAW